MSSKIIIKDPLYKQILVDKKYKKFLDSKEFQRLRHIKQTSFANYVYPSANHTRFSHSLGTFHLMKKIVDNGLMKISPKTKENLIFSALLHDIGHGPFSHLWEKVFPHFNHESATREILIRWDLNDVVEILNKKSEFSALISSTLDVDKLDYMARDSYFAGVSYGMLEVDFIIQHIYVKENKLIVKPSALSSVEDLITQRVNLFKTVYFHKISIEFDIIFENIFKRVRELLEKGDDIIINKHIKTFFDKTNTIDNLLALTDEIIIAQIHTWVESEDLILKDLCERFLYRTKMKIVNKDFEDINLKDLKKKIKTKYDLNYYFSHAKWEMKIIQTPIYLELKNKIVPIEKVSNLISNYHKNLIKVDFVLFPKEFYKKT